MSWLSQHGWGVERLAAWFWLCGYAIYMTRKYGRSQEHLANMLEWNNYMADRLERVEPVPMVILDGLGRDISHLNDEVPA